MNCDTVYALQGAGQVTPSRNVLATRTGLATAETLLTMGSDSGTNVTAFLPFPGQSDIVGSSNAGDPNANSAILLDNLGAKVGARGSNRPYFFQDSFNARGFRVRASGRFVSSAAANGILFKLYQNTKAAGPVLGGAGVIASIATGNTIGNGVTSSFIVEGVGMWDSVSGNMFGAEAWCAAAGVYATRAAGNATPFAVAAPLSNSLFFATVTFTTGAANAITPIELAIEDF